MVPEPDLNPYAPLTVLELPQTSGPAPTVVQQSLVIQAVWLVAVIVNLPVPLMLGYPLAQSSNSQGGVIVAIVLVWLIGVLCCTQSPGVMWRLIVGSAFTALSQFMPVAHMLIGLCAMGISSMIFNPDHVLGSNRISNIPEAFCTTMLTGFGLILLSLCLGAALIAVFRIKVFDARHPEST